MSWNISRKVISLPHYEIGKASFLLFGLSGEKKNKILHFLPGPMQWICPWERIYNYLFPSLPILHGAQISHSNLSLFCFPCRGTILISHCYTGEAIQVQAIVSAPGQLQITVVLPLSLCSTNIPNLFKIMKSKNNRKCETKSKGCGMLLLWCLLHNQI